jgi:nitroreductase
MKLREAAWNQPQITDASDLFVFCARTDFTQRIESYVQNTATTRNIPRENLQGFADMMTGFVDRLGDHAGAWAARQVYLALGFGLAAAAELGIDACPMEGFDPAAFHTLLELPEHVQVLSVMAVGYRDSSDEAAGYAKVRCTEEDLISEK